MPIQEQPAAIRAILREADRPTAVVAVTEMVAFQVIYEAMLLGLRVPQDLSVFGIVSRWRPYAAGMYIQSLMIPGFEVGQAAVGMLIERIGNPLKSLPTQAIPMIAMQGDTCAGVGL